MLVVGLALGVGTIVGAFTFNFFAILVNRLHHEHCTQTAALLANKAAVDYSGPDTLLSELAAQMVQTDPLLFVAFLDREGRTLAFARNRRDVMTPRVVSGVTPDTTIGTPRQLDAEGTLPYLDVTYPVRASRANADEPVGESRTTLLGYVRVGYSLERTFAEVSATVEMLTGIAVIVVALTIPLGFLLVRRIVGPVEDLSATMSRFADGDLSARSDCRRHDELGDLAAAYNVMADRLAQKHREISQLNAELEERVEERTHQLQDLAARDPLTGVYNRRHFSAVVQQAFAAARRYQMELTCLMIDMDDFKSVNDRYGHQVGDEVLCLTAMTITTELRSSDVVARYGGDEFILLLPQTDTAQARILGERILRKLGEAVAARYPDCGIGMSVGVASASDAGSESADDIIRAADKALYAAKTRGKHIVVAHAPVG